MMRNLKKKGSADRRMINMSDDFEMKYWAKNLGVTRDRLQLAVQKVGNSASAVRKELVGPSDENS